MTTTMPRLNLSDAVDDLAPAPPPCFLNRTSWVLFLKSAAAVQHHKGEQKLILNINGEREFNHDYDFCEDCNSRVAATMQAKGKCNPGHLKALKQK